MVFTRFPSCLAGPADDVVLPSNRVDFEAELVVVIGRAARNVSEARTLEHVAGYCVGQDVTDRRLQFQDKAPQFSLGKSLAGFGPVAYLSRHCALEPGDLTFTGTPAGVGSVRQPPRVLAVGERIETEIEGLGRLENRCVAPPA